MTTIEKRKVEQKERLAFDTGLPWREQTGRIGLPTESAAGGGASSPGIDEHTHRGNTPSRHQRDTSLTGARAHTRTEHVSHSKRYSRLKNTRPHTPRPHVHVSIRHKDLATAENKAAPPSVRSPELSARSLPSASHGLPSPVRHLRPTPRSRHPGAHGGSAAAPRACCSSLIRSRRIFSSSPG